MPPASRSWCWPSGAGELWAMWAGATLRPCGSTRSRRPLRASSQWPGQPDVHQRQLFSERAFTWWSWRRTVARLCRCVLRLLPPAMGHPLPFLASRTSIIEHQKGEAFPSNVILLKSPTAKRVPLSPIRKVSNNWPGPQSVGPMGRTRLGLDDGGSGPSCIAHSVHIVQFCRLSCLVADGCMP